MTTLHLPWPPSLNHYYRYGNGRFFISNEGKRFKMIVAGTMLQRGVKPYAGPVSVSIDAYPPDRRVRDLDNLNKCLLDSLVTRHGLAGLYHNDSQVKRIESTMHDFDAKSAGRVVISVQPWSGAEGVGVTVPAPRPPMFLSALGKASPAGAFV